MKHIQPHNIFKGESRGWVIADRQKESWIYSLDYDFINKQEIIELLDLFETRLKGIKFTWGIAKNKDSNDEIGRYLTSANLERYINEEEPSFREMVFNDGLLVLEKYADEWWKVKISYAKFNADQNIEIKVTFICDELTGVINCLEDNYDMITKYL